MTNLPAQVPTAPAEATAAPVIFTFQNGKPHAVRVHVDAHCDPLFHAGDLCDLLEYVNARDALRRHVESDDVVKRDVIDRLGRTQSANFVTEPGMWSLVLGSHAPNARKVKRWVTSEVLPTIRKTGRYQVATAIPAPDPTDEKITRAQYDQLCQANSRAFVGFIFGSEAPQHGHNALRVLFNLRTLTDLPAADFARAMAQVAWFEQAAAAFLNATLEARRRFLVEIIGQRGPWTPALLRKLTAEALEQLPPRPDWRALAAQAQPALPAGGAAGHPTNTGAPAVVQPL